MKTKQFQSKISRVSQDTHQMISHSMDILERIHELLDKKFDGKQHLLAKAMGKTEPEVSKWLNGVQNYTIKTIAKLEDAFGEKIISVATDSENERVTCEYVKYHHNEQPTTLHVVPGGELDKQTDFEKLCKTSVKPNVNSNIAS